MNIDAKTSVSSISNTGTTSTVSKKDSSANFADELKDLSKTDKAKSEENVDEAKSTEKTKKSEDDSKTVKEKEEKTSSDETKDGDEKLDDVIGGLQDAVEKINERLNHKDENSPDGLKKNHLFDDNKKNEDNSLINNDMNVQDPKELPLNMQMNMNMDFNTGGQPFAEFMNNQDSQKLRVSEADLKEENAILSTMAENIAMANKNMALAQSQETQIAPDTKTVVNSEGVKKVDKNTNVTVETVVKFDSVIMDKADVDFFANLVENGSVEMSEQTAKSSQVSKTLADLIAKSMNDNKPVRIDFDNNISVIIKISKSGKISADFLPSSQVAEAYLKENLPILRQRFDDNNIEYDELNQRKQKQDDKENRKKGRQDE